MVGMAENDTYGNESQSVDFHHLKMSMESVVYTLCNNYSRCSTSPSLANKSSQMKEFSLDLNTSAREFTMQNIISIVVLCNDHWYRPNTHVSLIFYPLLGTHHFWNYSRSRVLWKCPCCGGGYR
jgi:hypothetical protein